MKSIQGTIPGGLRPVNTWQINHQNRCIYNTIKDKKPNKPRPELTKKEDTVKLVAGMLQTSFQMDLTYTSQTEEGPLTPQSEKFNHIATNHSIDGNNLH